MELFSCITLGFLIFCQFKFCSTFETASFYGGSYITIPLQDARSTTEIQLRFRTKQPDALLFLAAGRTDYCLIKLQSGKLKVHINLGAGESELSSPKGLRLDDLIWHQISLNRKDGEVNVTIDKIHNIREKLPGRFFELNIYEGLFLGGIVDSLDLFLGHFDRLRGCLSAVFYNGVDVLKRARYRTFQSDAHGVTWSCASEFDAAFSSEISFMEDGAFMSLPNPISRTGVRWQFEIKTVSEYSMLFYNSKLVLGGRTDYVAFEIFNRKLHLVMDTGNGMTEVFNEATITDGDWHLVTVQINPNMLEIIVDGKFIGSSHVAFKTGNKYLDLSDIVYVGGLELNKQANALAVGIKSADKSFKGCLRNLEADTKLLGFPNAKITQGVLPNCMWSFMCAKNPCILEASCSQYGVDSFRCECDKPLCINPNYTAKYKVFSKASLPVALEILSLNPVQVMEGENVVITPDNINVILDYAKYGIRDSGVVFYVTQLPHHGSLNVGSNDLVTGNVDSNSVFSLLNLSNDKVRYVHDGSENYNDSVVIELEFTTSTGFILPAYLQGRSSFILHVDIAPVNDAPFLFLPRVKVLRLAESTRKIITADLVNASDSDNSNSELLYSILNQSNTNSIGHVEKLESPGYPITSFTQEDVDEGRIAYVHNGNATGDDKIALQVSDGVLSSSVSYLRVSIFPLQLYLVNNTGITLAQKTLALITHYNLSFQTNTEDPSLNINYKIVDLPKYGMIQCLLRASSNQEVWQSVSSFTSQQISREGVRYLHTEDTSSPYDVFKFKVSVKNLVLPATYELRATFVQLRLNVVLNKPIEITENQIAFVKESSLKVVTEPLTSNSSTIVYTLLQKPKVSVLVLGDRILKKNSTWTQKDILESRLSFQLHRKTFSNIEDTIAFSISAPQCQPIERSNMEFKYYPSDEQKNSIQVSVRIVQVSEGGQQPLLLEHLNVLKENMSVIIYQVLDGPSHGWLDMYDIDHTTIEKRNVTQFTNTDIMKQKVTYTHDDSESTTDAIYLLAYGGRGENFQYVTKLDFEILLRNDNPPYCIVNKGLKVVINGDKILSEINLLYEDADIDAKPEQILYTRREIPNGAFMLSTPPYNPLFEFTQSDINHKRVMFRHSGVLSVNISLWVSDGDHYSEFSFEIIASAPYVKVVNNTILLLLQGGEATLTTANLYADTNMNVASGSIRYKIVKNPSYGRIEMKGSAVEIFTQEDVENKQLHYRHNGDSNNLKDKFTFVVSARDVLVEDSFNIRLFPSVYWEPLILVNNKTLSVDEASDVPITRDDLLIQQAHVPPSDISYFVVQQPKYGYLEIEVDGHYSEVDFDYLFHPNSSDESKNTITFFDQATVDAEKLHYIQVILNQTHDYVVLDATNGIVWFRNIILNFVIIPEQLYLGGGELRVEEGNMVKLTSSLFPVYSPYYADKMTEYKVKKFPQHGWLQYVGSSSVTANISKWTTFQLNNQQIQYAHDGSETTNDSVTVVAFAGDKESIPAKVNIIILPINDEVPAIANNTGTSVWRGGFCNIISSQLAVVDRDTPSTNVTFVVVSAEAGYLTYASNLNVIIDKFTQAEIDSGKITFVHSGEELDGEFDVVVNDGKHTTEPFTFKIRISQPILYLFKNVDFQIFPLLRKAITPSHLLSWCSDTNKNVMYTVRSPPKYGLLTLMDANIMMPISNFSQADVNASRIWYQHTAHVVDSAVLNDSFMFDVVANYAESILNEIFDIKIAVSSGGLDGMLDIETYEVEEGGDVKIFVNTTNLINFLSSENIGLRFPSLEGTLSIPPVHGNLCVDVDCSIPKFTNEQMNTGAMVYKHDDSDSTYDNLTLTIYLEQGNITLCNITLHINVTPVNDQPFRLIQESPGLSIVQGEKFVLTQDQLLTLDDDTSPENIAYDIINGPITGSLYVNGTKGVGKFTQADINAGRVVYEHSGSVQSSSFHFRVSDGLYSPAYKVFNILVYAAKLNVTVIRPVFLTQGSNSTIIPNNIFNVATNHKANEVSYGITTAPRYGFILINNTRNTNFTQQDLRKERVMYVQSDISVPGDAFELEAALPNVDFEVKNLRVNISVEPLLKIGNFSPSMGVRTCINKTVLNAGPLAESSNSIPIFTIVKKPKHGKIQKSIRRTRKGGGGGNKREEDIDKFTYDEVKSEIICYVAEKLNSSTEDSFAFLLSALTVQPAIGVLKFHVYTESSSAARSTVAPPSSTSKQPKNYPQAKQKSSTDPSHVKSDVISSPNLTSDDYYVCVSLLFGILIVSLIFIVLVRCRSKKRAEDDTKTNPPLPLPRPPDDLLPSSPYPKRKNASLHSTPQCKVIPLGTDSVTSSEHDFNLRYPYGAADEDWSSCDTNGYAAHNNTPMLRKNQYWV